MFVVDYNLIVDQLTAFAGVVLVDLVMAGDNAIVVGMAASGVAAAERRKVILYGLTGAMVLRILFAGVATQILQIIGLTLTGGLLLLWVCWKMWRDIEEQRQALKANRDAPEDALVEDGAGDGPVTLRGAVVRIIVADISMSLDNVLAVAGIAKSHLWVLVAGLILSIALMGAAASLIARLLKRHHWIAYIGLAVVAYVAVDMIYRGTTEVVHATIPGGADR